MKKLILLVCLVAIVGCDCVKYSEADKLYVTKAEKYQDSCRYEIYMGTGMSSNLVYYDKECKFQIGDEIEVIKKGTK